MEKNAVCVIARRIKVCANRKNTDENGEKMVKLLEKLSFSVQGATKVNGREVPKPNEDRLFFDEKNGVFMLLDGVTRPDKEYIEAPGESAVGDIGDIVIDVAYRYIIDHLSDSDPENILRGAVGAANMLIKEYRQRKSEKEWGYLPSTIGIICLLRGRTLYYVCAGDCLGMLIRRGTKILFGKEWTLEAVDMLRMTKDERYAKYCNHPENTLSYTVLNGDDLVADNLEYSYLDLHEGDTVILSSDGICNYLKYEKSATVLSQAPEEMIARSAKYDKAPFATYIDDKAMIKISF